MKPILLFWFCCKFGKCSTSRSFFLIHKYIVSLCPCAVHVRLHIQYSREVTPHHKQSLKMHVETHSNVRSELTGSNKLDVISRCKQTCLCFWDRFDMKHTRNYNFTLSYIIRMIISCYQGLFSALPLLICSNKRHNNASNI